MDLRTFAAVGLLIAQGAAGAHAAPIAISEITEIDDLGYTCISGQYLEEDNGVAAVAFTLSGKIRMPRTCLPDPCDGAISRQELSQLTGTEMVLPRFESEWNEYYARYADHCRKEVVAFGVDPVPTVTPAEFWAPLIGGGATVVVDAAPTQVRLPTQIFSGKNGPPLAPLLAQVQGETFNTEETPTIPVPEIVPSSPEEPPEEPKQPEEPNTPPTPSPVPLPPSALMTLAAIGLLFAMRRRKQA